MAGAASDENKCVICLGVQLSWEGSCLASEGDKTSQVVNKRKPERWFGHVKHKSRKDYVSACRGLRWGKPEKGIEVERHGWTMCRRIWKKARLKKDDAQNRSTWRAGTMRSRLTYVSMKKLDVKLMMMMIIYLYIYPSIYLSIYLPIYLFIFLTIYQSINTFAIDIHCYHPSFLCPLFAVWTGSTIPINAITLSMIQNNEDLQDRAIWRGWILGKR